MLQFVSYFHCSLSAFSCKQASIVNIRYGGGLPSGVPVFAPCGVFLSEATVMNWCAFLVCSSVCSDIRAGFSLVEDESSS